MESQAAQTIGEQPCTNMVSGLQIKSETSCLRYLILHMKMHNCFFDFFFVIIIHGMLESNGLFAEQFGVLWE